MNNDLSTLEHLQKLARSSRKYTDSLVLELTDAFMKTIGGLQNQVGSSCICDLIAEEEGMGRNILDNCDFKINQRYAKGTIKTEGYFVDRWKLVDGEVTVEDTGLRLNGTIEQLLEEPINRPVVASVFFDNGIMAASYDDSSQSFRIKADGQLIQMAKLEVGNTQTLARQEGGKWILNDAPPNPALELLKCQRYYEANSWFSHVCIANSTNNISPTGTYFFNVPKRVIPKITVLLPNGIRIWDDTNTQITQTDIEAQVPGAYNRYTFAPWAKIINQSFVVGKVYRFIVNDNTYIASADL